MAAGLAGGLRDSVQQHIDEALADPVHHPEPMCWLWKGPRHSQELNLPSADELFTGIIDAPVPWGGRSRPVSGRRAASASV